MLDVGAKGGRKSTRRGLAANGSENRFYKKRPNRPLSLSNGCGGVAGRRVIIESDLSDIAKTQFILPMLDRSVSYPANSWEYPPVKSGSNYTYYIPLRDEMKGARIDAVVLGLKKGLEQFKSEVWITAYPAPCSEQLLSLVEGA